MKKSFFFLFFILSFALAAVAQLPNNSLVPDWTLSDIDGNSWNLYSLLDNDQSVIIYFGSTSDPDSWQFHTSDILQTTYQDYGPDATNEIMIFFVENDPITTLQDLQGSGSNTQGNWVNNTSYPIINSSALNNTYSTHPASPQIYHICPSRLITTMSFDDNDFYTPVSQCPAPIGDNNLRIFAPVNTNTIICDDSPITPSVTIQNYGNTNINNTAIELKINGLTQQTIDWNGILTPFQTQTLTFDPITITNETNIDINIDHVNNQTDSTNDPNHNLVQNTLTLAPQSNSYNIQLSLTTDNYGAETYWQITNETGEIIAFGGNIDVGADGGGTGIITGGAGAYNDNQNNFEIIEMEDIGCHQFLIVDAFGDGITGDGTFEIKDLQGNILVENTAFTDYYTTSFYQTIVPPGSPTSATDIQALISQTNINPNPTHDFSQLTVELSQSANLHIQLTNIFGQKLQLLANDFHPQGKHTFDIDTSQLPSGIYYIVTTVHNQQIVQKLVVAQ